MQMEFGLARMLLQHLLQPLVPLQSVILRLHLAAHQSVPRRVLLSLLQSVPVLPLVN